MSREMAKAMTRPSRFHTALGAGKAARRRRYGICPMWQPRAYGESGTWRRSLVRLSPGRSSYKRDLTWTRRETFRANPRRNGWTRRRRTGTAHRLRRIAREAMMVTSYYGIYQAERGKTTAEIRPVDAQL